MKNRPRIAVVGGGISGLSTAYFLEKEFEQSNHRVQIDLFEASDRLGGKIRTEKQDDMILECGAESFLSRKPNGIELCRELEIEDQLCGTRPETKKTFVWRDGQMHRLPEGLTGFVPTKLSSLGSTDLLTLSGKARMMLDLLKPGRKADSDESLASFISRRLGRQAYERLVQPLLCGIYCSDGKDLSLAATYPELRKLEKKYGSLIRGLKAKSLQAPPSKHPPFVTFPGGMCDLVSSVKENLKRTNIHFGKPIQSVVKSENGYTLNNVETFDVLVLTTPSFIASNLISELSPDLASVLDSIRHVSTAAVNLWYESSELQNQLDGYGFVIPFDQQNGITAVTWTSSKHFNRAPEHRKLVRVYLGRSGDELNLDSSDSEILETAVRELRRTMKIDTKPAGHLIHRWIQGSPQYEMGHLEKLKHIDSFLSELPGIFLNGASYRGVGIPDCIKNSKEVASKATQYVTEKLK